MGEEPRDIDVDVASTLRTGKSFEDRLSTIERLFDEQMQFIVDLRTEMAIHREHLKKLSSALDKLINRVNSLGR